MVPADPGVELGGVAGNQHSSITESISNAHPVAKRISVVGKSSPSGCRKHGASCALKTMS